jgi:hypothetical protein
LQVLSAPLSIKATIATLMMRILVVFCEARWDIVST